MSTSYRDTIFLPRTTFPLKGNHPAKEEEILLAWQGSDLYAQQRQARKARQKFILHDGPPYANGHLHIGHALNKILKDVVNRSQFMAGFDVVSVPGWDCHGLPIEWKVEENYQATGRKKREIPPGEFRQACRAFASHWVSIQKDEFQRMGIMGDWQKPYTTMTHEAEARIVSTFLDIFMNGHVYQGVKPVMWSVVEETALAEAEIEYQDITSPSLYALFPVKASPVSEVTDSAIVIWTTTPWTLPGNRAVAYGESLTYALIHIDAVAETPETPSSSPGGPRVGQKILVAQACIDRLCQETGITHFNIITTLEGKDLKDTVCHHPLKDQGYRMPIPLLPGDHVTADAGTGLVHTAPGHGLEDFALGQKFGLEIPQTVQENGIFHDSVPLFAGQHIYKVNPQVLQTLTEAGTLFHASTIKHSYPHSWRSKKPLIYRTTAQWFIAMDGKTEGTDTESTLREKALQAIDSVRWLPGSGKRRIQSMVQNRPDWCLSRQRSWGVPLTLFVNKKSGEPLRDPAVNQRIIAAIQEDGASAWFEHSPESLLGPTYKTEDFWQVNDILDVWFDSGVSHQFVLEQHPDLNQFPADLYLEGSDQHRGWFQSSLLTACALRGEAPYKAVFTHGFVLDGNGRKMSKSAGNVTSPADVIEKKGADILRLWAVSGDAHEDMRIGNEILKRHEDVYRRFRNTLRYLLGFLKPEHLEQPKPSNLPELEVWVLHRLAELNQKVEKALGSFDYRDVIFELHHFCALDLSAFYFDIRKDALYCDTAHSPRRTGALWTLGQIFSCLTKWLAPVLCFTAEEAWMTFLGKAETDTATSIHLGSFSKIPSGALNAALAEKYTHLRNYRRVITGAIELARAEKLLGSSLQAHVSVWAPSDPWQAWVAETDLETLIITSQVSCLWDQEAPTNAFTLPDIPGIAVTVSQSPGEKCERCWKVLKEVGQIHPDLCQRCQSAVEAAHVSS